MGTRHLTHKNYLLFYTLAMNGANTATYSNQPQKYNMFLDPKERPLPGCLLLTRGAVTFAP